MDILSQYIKYLNSQFAPRTAKRKIASVRAFYRELEFNERLEHNPFDKLRVRIHTPKQLPRTIPEHIIQEILTQAYIAYSPENVWSLRDKEVPPGLSGDEASPSFFYGYNYSTSVLKILLR